MCEVTTRHETNSYKVDFYIEIKVCFDRLYSRMFTTALLLLLTTCTSIADFQHIGANKSNIESGRTNHCFLTWTRPISTVPGQTQCECAPGMIEGQPVCRMMNGLEVHVEMYPEHCMTHDEDLNITYIGKCPYNSLEFYKDGESIPLPPIASDINNFVCNVSNLTGHHYFCGQQRRKGMLCGQCEDGLGPAVMSYTHPCIKCRWYGWLLYLALSFVPATILCALIIILRINILSPPLNAVVLLSHVMVSHVNRMPCIFLYSADKNHLATLVRYVLTLYGPLNMDFFVYVVSPFCISSSMSTLTVMALDYVVALYPLLLSALIYVIIEVHDRGCWLFVWVWKPLHKCLARFRQSWDIKGSIINAFATLYVLSFMKVISTSVRLMLTTHTFNIWGEQKWTNLYYNASCSLFQKCHCPYAILALTITTVVIIIPSLYIFLHPCKIFHKYKCLQCHKFRLANEIAKIFHHSFNDGMNGTFDHRWFAGIYLLIRIVIATAANWRTTQQIQVISSVVSLTLVAVFQPHTHAAYNYIDSFLFGGLTIIFTLMPSGQSHHIAQVLLFLLPSLTIIVFVCWKLKLKLTGKLHLLSRLHRLHHCLIKFRMHIGTNSNSTAQDCNALINTVN